MILKYIEKPEMSTLSYGVGLAFSLFTSEFCKAFFISLLWAVNLRTAVRLKGAFNSMAFQKVISLRVHTGISMGEVRVRAWVVFVFSSHKSLKMTAVTWVELLQTLRCDWL